MKVYKRNLLLTLLSALVSLVLMGGLLAVIYYFLKDYQGDIFKYAVVIAVVLFVLMFIPGLKEQVTVSGTALVLKGFRVKTVSTVNSGKKTSFGSVGTDPAKNIVVPFSTVTRIESARDMFFWRYNLRILADEFYQPAAISSSMNNHKQLYREIIDNVSKANPSVYVDPKFKKYL
ncbi:MAG: hypothetical protein IKK37_02495 [Clostridia bacterium]|nr:hypothetical protein [Clostridia bacterium]